MHRKQKFVIDLQTITNTITKQNTFILMSLRERISDELLKRKAKAEQIIQEEIIPANRIDKTSQSEEFNDLSRH